MEQSLLPAPSHCAFEHKVFTTLGQVSFRRSATDGVPMMAVTLGEREAMLPLDSLRREFAIDGDSPDGRMLDLIGSALDFVSSLEPGDRLPPEICTGQASWKPSSTHSSNAATRLRLDLIAWMEPTSPWATIARTEANLLRVADDPSFHAEIYAVAIPAAKRLQLRDGNEVVRLMGALAHELAFIEALRETLQARVAATCRRIGALLRDRRRPPGSFDTLAQVHRLAVADARLIIARFDDVEAQTGEIGSLLRNIENQRSFIRANRDWLYRTQRAWAALLDRWDDLGPVPGGALNPLLTATYQFLAQRSLPGTAWQRPRQTRPPASATAGMAW